jgi:hypothetical protein
MQLTCMLASIPPISQHPPPRTPARLTITSTDPTTCDEIQQAFERIQAETETVCTRATASYVIQLNNCTQVFDCTQNILRTYYQNCPPKLGRVSITLRAAPTCGKDRPTLFTNPDAINVPILPPASGILFDLQRLTQAGTARFALTVRSVGILCGNRRSVLLSIDMRRLSFVDTDVIDCALPGQAAVNTQGGTPIRIRGGTWSSTPPAWDPSPTRTVGPAVSLTDNRGSSGTLLSAQGTTFTGFKAADANGIIVVTKSTPNRLCMVFHGCRFVNNTVVGASSCLLLGLRFDNTDAGTPGKPPTLDFSRSVFAGVLMRYDVPAQNTAVTLLADCFPGTPQDDHSHTSPTPTLTRHTLLLRAGPDQNNLVCGELPTGATLSKVVGLKKEVASLAASVFPWNDVFYVKA